MAEVYSFDRFAKVYSTIVGIEPDLYAIADAERFDYQVLWLQAIALVAVQGVESQASE
jgi:hypothetical protein